MRRWLFISLSWKVVFVFLGAIFLCSCGGSKSTPISTGGGGTSGPAVLTSIQVNPSQASIAQNTTQTFTAQGTYSDGSTKDLTASVHWSCLLPDLATVSSTPPTQGVATATGSGSSGTALITASLGSVSNNAQLTVKPSTIVVTSLDVTPATGTIGYENQLQLTATATFSDGSTQDVTNVASWTSSAFPSIVTGGGLLIGNTLGTNLQVFASFNGTSPKTTPTFTVDLSNLVSVAVAPANFSTPNHTQLQYSAIGTFNDGSTRDLTSLAMNWIPSDYSIATNFGFIPNIFKFAAVGPVTITASVGNFTPSTTTTVTSATLQSVALTPANASLAPTTKLAYTATGTFSDGTTQDLTAIMTWFIQDNTGAASVNGKGLVTGLSAGTITVSTNSPFVFGFVPGAAPATVTAGTLQSITVKPPTAFIVPGNSFKFSAIGTFDDGSTQDISNIVTWTSSNSLVSATTTDVATILAGVATSQGVGDTTITAKLGTITGTADLMVVPPSEVSVAVKPAMVSISSGATTQFTATGTFVDGSTQDFTTLVNWSSSDATAATVGYQTGIVSGLATGTSTITAALGSVTSTGQVTVQ